MERDDEMPEFVTGNSDDRCNTQYVKENEADKKNKDPMAGVHGISLSIVINSDGLGRQQMEKRLGLLLQMLDLKMEMS